MKLVVEENAMKDNENWEECKVVGPKPGRISVTKTCIIRKHRNFREYY